MSLRRPHAGGAGSAGSTAARVRFDASVPLHHQAYLELRRDIADGLWEGRSDFPGEKELAERLGISVITSRAALDRLVGDGWIERRRGRRPRVLHRPEVAAKDDRPGILEFGSLRAYTYTVLEAGTSIAPVEACAAFGLSSGEYLWQCMRLRHHKGAAHSVTHNVQRPAVGERHTMRQLEKESMARILAQQGHSFAHIRRRMGITHAPTVVTEALGLTIAERVLVSTFTLHDPSDEVLEWVRIFLHPDHDTPEETLDLATGTWSMEDVM